MKVEGGYFTQIDRIILSFISIAIFVVTNNINDGKFRMLIPLILRNLNGKNIQQLYHSPRKKQTNKQEKQNKNIL